jgi:hypothetical protein
MDSRRGFVGKMIAGFVASKLSKRSNIAMETPTRVIVEFGKPVTINKPRIFANPPLVHIGSGPMQIQEVAIVNNSGGDIRVWMPLGAKVFDDRSVSDFSVPFLVPQATDRTLYVKNNPQEGKYEYHVYCEVIEDYAEGNSPPVMNCP